MNKKGTCTTDGDCPHSFSWHCCCQARNAGEECEKNTVGGGAPEAGAVPRGDVREAHREDARLRRRVEGLGPALRPPRRARRRQASIGGADGAHARARAQRSAELHGGVDYLKAPPEEGGVAR